ncbi:hypothetical protein EVAR_43226_1 [Eumeta japonica]|uniref:Uncharacterized protein n=1 Tax=Eumeta variegata TaxID=151549 RepID=A0A4C1WSH0_EUMVA|nr:hypothetical protein EVAR_43226_1 [Eumeta japonica]
MTHKAYSGEVPAIKMVLTVFPAGGTMAEFSGSDEHPAISALDGGTVCNKLPHLFSRSTSHVSTFERCPRRPRVGALLTVRRGVRAVHASVDRCPAYLLAAVDEWGTCPLFCLCTPYAGRATTRSKDRNATLICYY